MVFNVKIVALFRGIHLVLHHNSIHRVCPINSMFLAVSIYRMSSFALAIKQQSSSDAKPDQVHNSCCETL